MGNRRRGQRLDVRLPVRCRYVRPNGTVGAPFAGTLTNISSVGAHLRTAEDVGFTAELHLQLSLDAQELALDAEIVRRGLAQGDRAYGLRFVRVSPIEQAAITRYVFTRLARLSDAPSGPRAESLSAA